MSRKAIYKDTSLCVECQACRVACQTHNGLKPEQVYIKLTGVEQGVYPKTSYLLARKSCMHCGVAPCVGVCPVKALSKVASGFTRFDRDKCIGCEACVGACPYKAPEMQNGKAERCVGCPDLVDAGRPPACVATCIAIALRFGDRTAMLAEGEKRTGRIKKAFPQAELYGKTAHGGLGLLQVIRDKPAVFKLPA